MSLTDEIARLRAEIETLTEQNAEALVNVESLTGQLEQAQANIDTLSGSLAQSDAALVEMTAARDTAIEETRLSVQDTLKANAMLALSPAHTDVSGGDMVDDSTGGDPEPDADVPGLWDQYCALPHASPERSSFYQANMDAMTEEARGMTSEKFARYSGE